MPSPKCFGEILLVEDNPGDVRLIEETLRDADLDPTLHVVSDGREALEFLHRTGSHSDAPRPDLVLLDLHLPRMDGDEVLEEMCEEVRDVPVIVLSGSQLGADLKLEDVKSDVAACVEKPLEPEEFTELTESLET